MNNRLGFGLFLIFIGIVWMLTQLDLIDLNIFEALWDLWPLIFVVIGLNMIFKKSAVARTIVWILFFSALITYGMLVDSNDFNFRWSANRTYETAEYVVADKGFEDGKLLMNIGLGDLNIDSSSTSAIKMDYPDEITSIDTIETGSGNFELDLNTKEHRIINIFGKSKNLKYDVELSKNMEWDIEVNTGVIDGHLDLRELTVDKLKLDLGAGQLDIYYGLQDISSKVIINGATTDITIYIPKSMGMKAEFSGAIKNVKIDNIPNVKEDSEYISNNYNDADETIDIQINSAIGDLKIIGY